MKLFSKLCFQPLKKLITANWEIEKKLSLQRRVPLRAELQRGLQPQLQRGLQPQLSKLSGLNSRGAKGPRFHDW